MKIHFVGFSEEFDEWRDYDYQRDYFPFVRLKKMFLPNGISIISVMADSPALSFSFEMV